MSNSLTEWLSEMERLDKEAKEGLLFEAHERDISMRWVIDERTRGICFRGLTELPRAVRIIKFLLNEAASWKAHALSDTGDWYETREMLIENYDAHLKKILNEDGGEG